MKSLPHPRRHVARSTHTERMIMSKEKLLHPQMDDKGYLHVRLYGDDGVVHLWKLHQFVAAAFLGYDRKKYDRHNVQSITVDHIDNDKTNNRLDNLQLITQLENIRKRYTK